MLRYTTESTSTPVSDRVEATALYAGMHAIVQFIRSCETCVYIFPSPVSRWQSLSRSVLGAVCVAVFTHIGFK